MQCTGHTGIEHSPSVYIYIMNSWLDTHTYMDVDIQTDAPNLWFNKVQVYYR